MKRMTSFLLAIMIVIGCVSFAAPRVHAAEMKMSDEGMRILKAEEGFSKYPYWDYKQYTVGYGTRCPSDMVNHYKKYGISKTEAETLLRNYMSGMEYTLNRYIERNNLVLTQNQYDAIALFSYNVGTGWTKESSGIFYRAITNGATGNDLIRAFGLWCKADGEIKSYLLRRRMSEANMYLNGVYSQQPPESYGYVVYSANGGSVCHSSQVFDSSRPPRPACSATRSGYTFLGWYTAAVGGRKVTYLDRTVKGLTLYAQWISDSEFENYTDTVDVTVEVTGNGINLRKGPGTAYDVIGHAQNGNSLLVTETVQLGEILWGRTDKGWISLRYTDFEEVYAALPPEAFLPTEPDFTEPEPTEPEVTQWKGKVTASTLNIRAEAGTSGSYVGYYANGTEIVIFEKTTVNGVQWGRTDRGWVCLTYVEIEEPEEPVVPDVTEPDATEPDATEPDATEPDATEPDATEPDATEPDATEPDTTEPDTTEPDATEPDATEPDATEPDATEPDATEPDTTEPDATEPDTTEPDATEPDATEPDATEPDATEPTQWEGKVTASTLNIRATAGTSGRYVGYYVKGTKIVILEKKAVSGVQWGRTDKGWVCLTYVSIEEPKDPVVPKPEEPTKWEGKVTASSLNIRATAGTNGRYVGYYVKGAKIVILEKKTVSGVQWGRTDKGWVCLTYVKIEDNSPQPVIKTVTASALRVRSGPGTSYAVVGSLYKDTKVTILETKSVGGVQWGRIDKGWISMQYVK